MSRTTRKDCEALLVLAQKLRDQLTPGLDRLCLYGGNGRLGVFTRDAVSGGVSDISYTLSIRECYEFLRGYVKGLEFLCK